MKIRDVMTKDVHLARPADTIQDVASRMAKGGFGFVPVADGDQLIGTITDRDIVVRALATGAASSASVVSRSSNRSSRPRNRGSHHPSNGRRVW